MKTLFVRNLNFDTQTHQLQDLFADYGEVLKTDIILNRETGLSRGFGFVEMETEEGAAKAVQDLADVILDGRRLKVEYARPREGRPRNAY